jgi:hypothetical protein
MTLPAAPQRAQGFARTGETRRAPGDGVAPRAVASVRRTDPRAVCARVSAGEKRGTRSARRRVQGRCRRRCRRAGCAAARRGEHLREEQGISPGRGKRENRALGQLVGPLEPSGPSGHIRSQSVRRGAQTEVWGLNQKFGEDL